MRQATLAQENWTGNQRVSLLDLLDRLLEKGVVVDGEILLTVADIDLVYLGLKCVLASVETLEKNSSDKPLLCHCEPAEGGRSNLEIATAPSGPRDDASRHPEGQRPEGSERSFASLRTTSGVPSRNDDVKERPSDISLQEDKAPLSAKEKRETMETKQDFRETPFFENPGTTQASRVSSKESRNKVNIESEKVEKGLVKLVLTVVELLRKLMERQAIRRMEGGSIRPQKMEELGLAFLRLDEKMKELKKFFGLKDEDLNLNLGPLGNLV